MKKIIPWQPTSFLPNLPMEAGENRAATKIPQARPNVQVPGK